MQGDNFMPIIPALKQDITEFPEPRPALLDVPPPVREESVPGDNEPGSASSKKGEIMIVDDNAALRLLLRCILEEAGYMVIEAKDGVEAMELVLKKSPDLMILDLNMPRMKGQEVIKRVHQSMTVFPIIVLTTNSDAKSQVETLALGADDYIIKPFIPSIVLARVKAAMRRMGK
jgi:CheY-like chemotaxis protein